MAGSQAEASSLKEVAGTIVLIGAGKMGSAMLDGWIGLGLEPSRVAVMEPHPAPEISALVARGLKLNPDSDAVPDPAVIVIAVKPQVAAEVVPAAAPLVGCSTVVVSIMAGQRLPPLERALPAGSAVVRTMPYTPAAIGRGITVAVANGRVSPSQRDLAHRLLAAIGAVEWVEDEALLDAVTAVSGSGPAYVFLLAEVLAQAGVAVGLPADLSDRLARATVAGSGELLHRSPLDAGMLRRNVAPPGGTTGAALAVLMNEKALAPLMGQAVAPPPRRSRELAG